MNYNSQGLGFGGRSPGYALCIPTNYNGYQPTVTDLLDRVRLVRAHELQHKILEQLPSGFLGAPCAHQRITTVNTVV